MVAYGGRQWQPLKLQNETDIFTVVLPALLPKSEFRGLCRLF